MATLWPRSRRPLPGSGGAWQGASALCPFLSSGAAQHWLYRTRVPHLPVCRYKARTQSSAMSTVRNFENPIKNGVCGKNRAVAPSSGQRSRRLRLVTGMKSECLLGGRSVDSCGDGGVCTLTLATETSCPPLGRGHDSGVPRGQLSLAVAALCLRSAVGTQAADTPVRKAGAFTRLSCHCTHQGLWYQRRVCKVHFCGHQGHDPAGPA